MTTNDAIFKAFTASTSQIDAATKEVLRYREALWQALADLKERPILSTNLFIKIVETIKKNKAGIRNTPGTTITNTTTGEVIYTPLLGERTIRDKLKNLEDFIHDHVNMDALVKLALIHYQFEAIHPFFDGNGRTGRIINILFLVQHGLLDLPVLYLSKAIIENKREYYRLLRNVTVKGEWEPWILFMLNSIEETAVFTRERIIAIRNLMLETIEKARKELPDRFYSKELIELLFHQPYCKIAFLVEEKIASRNIASKYLHELVKIGILKKETVGKENIYLNHALYDLLSR